MQDAERVPAPIGIGCRARGSDPDPEPPPEPCVEREPARRWSAEDKARIVRESFWPGERVSDVAERYGLSSRQLSVWRTLAREGKLTLPSSAGPEPEPVAAAPEPAFAVLEVDPAPPHHGRHRPPPRRGGPRHVQSDENFATVHHGSPSWLEALLVEQPSLKPPV